MKDIAGPGQINLSNCGTVIIRKQTSPDENANTTNFTYTTDVTTLPATTTSPFTLQDDGVKTINNVVAGSTQKTVTEDNPGPNYALSSINCSASTVPSANITTSVPNRNVQFTLGAGQALDCMFTNTQQTGAIEITKTRKHAAATSGNPLSQPHAGVTFPISDGDANTTDPTVGTDANVRHVSTAWRSRATTS
jgi:hypothetical protein